MLCHGGLVHALACTASAPAPYPVQASVAAADSNAMLLHAASMSCSFLHSNHRGRDPGFPGPPAQIRTYALTYTAPPSGCTPVRDGKSSCRPVVADFQFWPVPFYQQFQRIGTKMSYNQTDLIKDRVAVEIQMGKYSFVAHDLFVKHLSFFVSDVIDVGIEMLPMKEMESEMSSGVPYYERDLLNVIRQGLGVPAVPLILIGISP